MCRILVGMPGREEKFALEHESREAMEGLLKEFEKMPSWPVEPVVLDVFGQDPPLVLNPNKMEYITVERCKALHEHLAGKRVEKVSTA